jgi:hypothetical protein
MWIPVAGLASLPDRLELAWELDLASPSVLELQSESESESD